MVCILFNAMLARSLFAIHGIITVLRVTDVHSDPLYYLLIIPVCLLPLEMVLMLKLTDDGQWPWFCPSVLLYLGSVVPGIWFLNFDVYQKRIEYRDSMGWEDCSMVDTSYNTSSLNAEVAGVTLPLALSDHRERSDDSWILALEQLLLALLLLGRWLLPKGSLTRDQLSQLLLMYIMMAADILEFSSQSLEAQAVICNLHLIIAILILWSLSLLQFSSYFWFRETEIWVLWIAFIMQDGPFLAMRLYLLIKYGIINQMMLLFTLKNILVILLQLYLMLSKCFGDDNNVDVVV